MMINTEEIEETFNKIEQLKQENPEEALNCLICATIQINQFLLNNAISNIMGQLQTWINKLKNYLKKIAKSLNAHTFSISVSAPAGIAVTITWKT